MTTQISTKNFLNLIEKSGDTYWEYRPLTQELYISEQIYKILGYDENDFLIDLAQWAKLVHPEDYKSATKKFAQLLQTSSDYYESEIRVKHKDGSYIWLLSRGQSVEQNSDGTTTLFIGTHIDITTRKNLELELIDSKEKSQKTIDRLQNIFSATDDGYWEWDLSDNSLFLSPSWKEMLGFKDYELENTFNTWENLLHPEDIYAKELAIELANNATTNYRVEFRMRCKDGTYKWILARAKTIQNNANGSPRLIMGTHVDITERKILAQELNKSHDVLRKLTNNVPGAIYQYRLYPDGRATFPYISKGIENLYEISPNDVLHDATAAFKRIHQDDLEMMVSTIESSAKTMKDWDIEYRVNLPKKGTRWVEGHAKPEKLEDGSTLWHGFIYDITDKKNIENKLHESSKYNSELNRILPVGVVVYDVKMAIASYANNAASKILRMSHDVFIGKTINPLKYKVIKDDGSEYSVEEFPSMLTIKDALPRRNSLMGIEFEDQTTWVSINTEPLFINGVMKSVIVTFADITKERLLLDEIENERLRFSTATEGTLDGLWDWNIQNGTLVHSKQLEKILGYDGEEIPQTIEAWMDLIHPEDANEVAKRIDIYFKSQGKLRYESRMRMRTKAGSYIWTVGRAKAIFDKEGNPIRLIGFLSDITRQMQHQQELEHSAKYDQLTDLPNRFLFNELLQNSMNHCNRATKELAVVYIDLDGFKEINDTHGHDVGDDVLIEIAKRIRHTIREEDVASRLGGDEFAICISDLNANEDIITLLQRLLENISEPIIHHSAKNNILQLSASIGVASYPQLGDVGPAVLIREADHAMYEAKSKGRNQYQFFDMQQNNLLKEHQKRKNEILLALENSEFHMYYQPKVNMKSGDVIGFEALIRWHHPIDGLLYPDQFLPLIKNEKEIMIMLGEWVTETSFAQLNSWNELGYNYILGINISAHEFQDITLLDRLKVLIERYPNVSAEQVELEILETHALEDLETAKKMILNCKELGFRVALDDFGTGYSTLSYLKELPIDVLKIDKSFVMEMLHDSGSFSIIEAAMGLAHAFSCEVVAEGVEDIEHGVMLQQLGCDIAQGYAIAKAMPKEETVPWVESYKGYTKWTEESNSTPKDRNLLLATIEHRNWIITLEAYINDPINSPTPKLNHTKCRFSDWLGNKTIDSFKGSSAFEEIVSEHKKLHQLAASIITHIEKKQSTEKLMNEILSLHASILEKLKTLQLTS